MTESMEDGIGKRLSFARRQLNLTQAEMAKLLGLTEGTYARYERGSFTPKAPQLAELRRCGIDLNWLLTGIGEPAAAPATGANSVLDAALLQRIIDGLSEVWREEGQRLPSGLQIREAAAIYDDLVGLEDEAERRGGLRVALEHRRRELRRAAEDPASAKRPA